MVRRGFSRLFRTGLSVIGAAVLLAACSMGNDFGARVPVTKAFPELSSVPQRPEQTLTPAEKDELLREMQELQRKHGNTTAGATGS